MLYLYYPYWPYGLYRTLVPVQGCTLPFLHIENKCIYFILSFKYSPFSAWGLSALPIHVGYIDRAKKICCGWRQYVGQLLYDMCVCQVCWNMTRAWDILVFVQRRAVDCCKLKNGAKGSTAWTWWLWEVSAGCIYTLCWWKVLRWELYKEFFRKSNLSLIIDGNFIL